MRILLFGEYSNLHATLAKGLRELGHQVTVISDGAWRDYKRDINLVRQSSSKIGGIKYMLDIICLLPRLRHYDIVQLINPDFIRLKSEREILLYRYLRKHNKHLFIGAFGADWYWVDDGLHKKSFRYGDFYVGDKMRTDEPQVQHAIHEWVDTPKGTYCQEVMNDCDGIPTCLYEYQKCYADYFPEKTRYIPLPIDTLENNVSDGIDQVPKKVKVFIGIDADRMAYKGTDIMLMAAEDLQSRYPDKMELMKVYSLPYHEYQQIMNGSDVILDQLYSYTPSMNSLLAMSKGIVVVGGGEPENYEILGEKELRPIINVQPSYESVYHELEELIIHPERLPNLKRQSIEYIRRHHDYLKVAKEYETFYHEKG